MKLQILEAAKLYFGLRELAAKELSHTTAYRVARNLDRLKWIGKRFSEEVQKEMDALKDGAKDIAYQEFVVMSQKADAAVSTRWEALQETEDIDLKMIDISNETGTIAPALLEKIIVVLVDPNENEA
jgi:hypothetical protein